MLPPSDEVVEIQAPEPVTKRGPQRKQSDTSFATEGSRKKPTTRKGKGNAQDQSMEVLSQKSERSSRRKRESKQKGKTQEVDQDL